MKFDDGPPLDGAVAQGLSALKREGGSVLVVGAARASHDDVCERFLGEETDHVYVRTDGTRSGDDDAAAVVEMPVQTRSAARAASPSASPTGLDSLERKVGSTMERVAEPGTELRICFDSLRPFVDATPEPDLVAFLQSLQSTARDTGAVIHFHLPAMADAVPEGLYGPVDAIVELSRRGESTYQQWHLPEVGESTDWVSV